MTAYYNEFDPKAAAWLRELIEMNMIAPGEVDERSITDVPASDLRGYTQHHFFAGVGVWSFALRNSAWPDSRPVCTASLPCQPFSAAGKQLGKADERHLLPHFLDLVRECGFNTIFGEQVESAIRHGWLDDLQANMETEGYALGHAVLGAHSSGSFHQRQRLYWVANDYGKRLSKQPGDSRISPEAHGNDQGQDANRGCSLGHTKHDGYAARQNRGIDEEDVRRTKKKPYVSEQSTGTGASRMLPDSVMGYAGRESSEWDSGAVYSEEEKQYCAGQQDGDKSFRYPDASEIDWIYCRDGKYRAIKSGLKPLVDGASRGVVYSGDESQPIDANYTAEARVMRLKGYGNAIHAGTAEMFIRAFMESA